MKKLSYLTILALFGALFTITSCNKDEGVVGTQDDDGNTTSTVTTDDDHDHDHEDDDDHTDDEVYAFDGTAAGTFITNEGNFMSGDGSVSFFDRTADTVVNLLFKNANGAPLGDVVQSMVVNDDKGYVMVNNSNKIEVVSIKDFKSVATIEGITKPRYMAINGTTGYVTSFSTNRVYVLDLVSNTLSDSIDVGVGPEQLVITRDMLYVMNAAGYGGLDSTIMLIDMVSNTVTDTIEVGYNPALVIADANEDLWIVCKGKADYSNWPTVGYEGSKLVRLATSSGNIVLEMSLWTDKAPKAIKVNSDFSQIYIGGGMEIYGIGLGTTETVAPSTALISATNYNFTLGDNDEILLLEDASTSNGKMHRYDASGTLIKGDYEVGVFPGGGTSGLEKAERTDLF